MYVLKKTILCVLLLNYEHKQHFMWNTNKQRLTANHCLLFSVNTANKLSCIGYRKQGGKPSPTQQQTRSTVILVLDTYTIQRITGQIIFYSSVYFTNKPNLVRYTRWRLGTNYSIHMKILTSKEIHVRCMKKRLWDKLPSVLSVNNKRTQQSVSNVREKNFV